MKNYAKILLPLFLMSSIHGSLYADIIEVTLESTAGGFFFQNSSESTQAPTYDAPQIAVEFGGANFGSAGAFDSISDIEGDEILFKNGNSAFGWQASSSSRTVVNIEFENSESEAFIPTLRSQILPAGMGFYLSDCDGDNLRICQTNDSIDFNFENIGSTSGLASTLMSAQFEFQVLLADEVDPLFSLSGGIEATVDDNDQNFQIINTLGDAERALNNFRQTSPILSSVGSLRQYTFDWGATDFDVIFPRELAPNDIAKLSYIIEVTTTTSSDCLSNGLACPVAYAAFGDPIGRGGAAGPRTETQSSASLATARSASFVTASVSDTQINGYEAGLYRMAAPTLKDGILTYRANSGPGITSTTVSAPSSIAFLVLAGVYLSLSRKRYLK